jgi:hypothetical protein
MFNAQPAESACNRYKADWENNIPLFVHTALTEGTSSAFVLTTI